MFLVLCILWPEKQLCFLYVFHSIINFIYFVFLKEFFARSIEQKWDLLLIIFHIDQFAVLQSQFFSHVWAEQKRTSRIKDVQRFIRIKINSFISCINDVTWLNLCKKNKIPCKIRLIILTQLFKCEFI